MSSNRPTPGSSSPSVPQQPNTGTQRRPSTSFPHRRRPSLQSSPLIGAGTGTDTAASSPGGGSPRAPTAASLFSPSPVVGGHASYFPGPSSPSGRHLRDDTPSPTAGPSPAGGNGGIDVPSPARSPSPSLPLTMTASAVLTALPRDARGALADASRAAGFGPDEKVVVRWKAVAGAPPVPRPLAKISAGQRFDAVVNYLRKVLRIKDTESLFLYVNQAFAPALDEVVGNLHRCFKDSNGQLIVAYAITPAFG